MNSHIINPIGHIETPFKQKFSIPRQGCLSSAKGKVVLNDDFDEHSVSGLNKFSHLWLLFLFSENLSRGWQQQVKMPRLGGNKRTGVFASRSTHRPNGIGMSAVKLERIEVQSGNVCLFVEGVDLLNMTPIIDIKPYVHYSDRLENATDPLASLGDIAQLAVSFSPDAIAFLATLPEKFRAECQQLIIDVLAQDPRPAYKRAQTNDTKEYRVALYDFDIAWRILSTGVEVVDIVPTR